MYPLVDDIKNPGLNGANNRVLFLFSLKGTRMQIWNNCSAL